MEPEDDGRTQQKLEAKTTKRTQPWQACPPYSHGPGPGHSAGPARTWNRSVKLPNEPKNGARMRGARCKTTQLQQRAGPLLPIKYDATLKRFMRTVDLIHRKRDGEELSA